MSTFAIGGATRLYAIVGDPIVQVKSPELYCTLFAAAGMNAVMVPAHVPASQFDAVMPALMGLANLDGLLVTVPYKARAVGMADRLGPTASCIGALNALRRDADGAWSGDMFDGAGFVCAAERKGHVLQGRRVALFGAGGAGSAIGYELVAAGVESLDIIDPQRQRAEALVDTLRRAFGDCRIASATSLPPTANMIVNASTVGMGGGDGLPGEIGDLDSATLVGDVIVSQQPTPLLRHAIDHGCQTISGPEMLRGQSDALMSFFTRD
ncbi:MAG: shikimate dehydrogenase [Casimicrobiaceae bacterium]